VEDDWRNFSWRDGERTILFGEGRLAASPELLAEHGYATYDLLSTGRALADAPEGLAAAAANVHEVVSGGVDEVSASLLEAISSEDLVAFGGGRVVDVAKAIVAVRGGRVAAIPTTLAGSTITGIHRLPAGHKSKVKGLVRPALAIADPVAMTTSPEQQLRATAMNALGHAAESLYAPGANPVAEMAALRGAELIALGLDTEREIRDRDALALGAILGGYAIGSTGLALHHAICQTLVRVLGLPHAEVNATMLPHTMSAMSQRAPHQIAALAAALGTSAGAIAARISELSGGVRHLADLGADKDRIDEVVDALEARGDATANTPGSPGREDFRAIIETAW
jgi:alcohol dehydrogenase class IV